MRNEDRASIAEVIHRYGVALDARDAEGVLACFTDDVCLEYFNGAVVANGVDEARKFFRFDGSGSALPGLDSILSTTHLWNVGAIDGVGDQVTVSTSCIAYLLGLADGQGVLVTRGLRYVDDLRRSSSGWQISHRRHLPDWEARTPAVVSSPTQSL